VGKKKRAGNDRRNHLTNKKKKKQKKKSSGGEGNSKTSAFLPQPGKKGEISSLRALVCTSLEGKRGRDRNRRHSSLKNFWVVEGKGKEEVYLATSPHAH